MHADVVIIGSGVGGSAVAYQLAGTGAKVLVIERGEHLPREMQNWDAEAVFGQLRYRTRDTWVNGQDQRYRPGQYYFVGGHTKFFGAAMFRFREADFEELRHEEGVSPAWPISYRELEPYYEQAESLFGVRGAAGQDPTEPHRAHDYTHGPIPDEPVIARLREKLRDQGLHPFFMPASVDFGNGGKCVRCGTCDAFPCRIDAKGDAEICLLRPAVKKGGVSLLTGAKVTRLLTDATGKRICSAIAETRNETIEITADTFVLSAGAINSATLLLASANKNYPKGLANSSDAVGRFYMNHNCTAVLGIDPRSVNETRFPKTLSLNDFYFGGKHDSWPLGNIQMLGKIRAPMLRGALPWVPSKFLDYLSRHSIDLYAMSEDLPSPDSRVEVTSWGQIKLTWRRTNLKPHMRLVDRTKQLLKQAGYPLVVSRRFGDDTPSHQCGTVRFGNDPKSAPLDPFCKAYDHDNLYVVDASFFPSSAAVNPALTVAAQALRVGEHLGRMLACGNLSVPRVGGG
ncbi:FAD-dependent oxidoreductase [Paraburkholderia sp. CNPSo 3157]|uniref:FAD-dependent oxidoreductase n=1 Tax=Paraburkholderia franconis TaxID=2654983 RepID=A0A7X1NKR0_9BURK|nr:GMC family oxidoreductase [Paraburkholderia franconis]MPW23807.1 FAD-dependent oxidoreductase [Paraburkholderia franconis]